MIQPASFLATVNIVQLGPDALQDLHFARTNATSGHAARSTARPELTRRVGPPIATRALLGATVKIEPAPA